MSDADEPRSTQSWWQTVPGLLTAAAGLITAVTGLVVALHQIFGGSGESGATPTVAVTHDAGADGGTATTASTGRYRVTFPAGTHGQVEEAVYDVRSGDATMRNPGELTLTLRIRMTNNGRFPANFWNGAFRLLVGGAARAPTGSLDDVVDARASDDGSVEFVVPSSARRVVLVVGDAVRLPVAILPG